MLTITFMDDSLRAKASAIAELLVWETRDPDQLRVLLSTWFARHKLSDEDAEQVVQLVCGLPEL